MTIIATFANSGEAAFVQSLLENEGIVVYLSDPGIEISGAPQVRLSVDETDISKATAIIGRFNREKKDDPTEKKEPHPATGFPFMGIAGLFAMVWACVSMAAIYLDIQKQPSAQREDVWAAVIGLGLASLIKGLFLGCVVALVVLIAKVTWKKLTTT